MNTPQTNQRQPPQVPPPTPAEAQQQLQVMRPHIGGIIQITSHVHEAWTGGSNIHQNGMPLNVLCRRPLDFKAMNTVQEKYKEGLEAWFRLAAVDETSDVLITSWIEMIAQNMETLGMDTVFKIPNATNTHETDLLIDWTSIALIDIDEWINRLKSGIGTSNLCIYDRQNLQ